MSTATPRDAPVGFNNTGAICWFNSLLQSLIAVNPALPAENRPIIAQFAAAVDHPNESSSIALLRAFLPECRARGHSANFGGNQECAEEGLTLLVDALDCKTGTVDGQFRTIYNRSITCTQCSAITANRDQSIDIKLFDRATLSALPRQKTTFTEYLRSHLSPCDSFTCPKCSAVTRNATFSEQLVQANNVITVVLPKFDEKYLQWFPNELSFVLRSGAVITYDLVAQIEHSGTRSGGHYWAIVKKDSGIYRCNDSHISAGVLGPTEETFILFYRKA